MSCMQMSLELRTIPIVCFLLEAGSQQHWLRPTKAWILEKISPLSQVKFDTSRLTAVSSIMLNTMRGQDPLAFWPLTMEVAPTGELDLQLELRTFTWSLEGGCTCSLKTSPGSSSQKHDHGTWGCNLDTGRTWCCPSVARRHSWSTIVTVSLFCSFSFQKEHTRISLKGKACGQKAK